MKIRDRIRELRRVRAGDLAPHPRNWRTHPKAQQEALRGLLAEIGYADALLARELDDGTLQLVDGHLRAETTPDQEVPVLVLDLDEGEANKLLATLDPLAALAGRDEEALADLLGTIESDSEALQGLLSGLSEDAGRFDPDAGSMPPLGGEGGSAGAGYRLMTFTVSDDQHEAIERALTVALTGEMMGDPDEGENENQKGNALHRLALRYLERAEAKGG